MKSTVRGVTAVRTAALSLESVSRRYGGRGGDGRGTTALDAVSCAVPAGSFTAVVGPSGSGKSTFLLCAAGLDRPTSGTVRIGGTDLGSLSEAALTRLRRDRVGFVFQSHALNLVPSLSIEENVVLPLVLAGADPAAADVLGRGRELLARVGLGGRGQDRPSTLSGGQQQRVAVARALVTGPDVIFADEPTASLDPDSAALVLALLRDAVRIDGRTVVMVTHDPAAADRADTVLTMRDGRLG
ncbi:MULTISPECIES: ABC transporter ATP-binding protein [Streptomyces]|uniref:ABC transporter ATP-binding protein n=1 Tax=Streptomyces halstedii TaxID=1944 RepID=A0A6N9TWE7_STRHA|nr:MULTISPECIES: ABC transporter ATP-binding protein [Streptomyces]AWL41378.1 ABC transporter ATP-binding protein [Streptomyces sp. SM18]MBV7671862.1 ABC transporter ATP-binding protein [Streptomyces halstedii]NEA14889.1 ABC transporter ATP-binding protein [Streptomyces halstedii]